MTPLAQLMLFAIIYLFLLKKVVKFLKIDHDLIQLITAYALMIGLIWHTVKS
jgi:hypothetical protein